MDLDLGCVASFLVLVEECHYGRAAQRLHLTASALTKRIQRLEAQVGTELLLRGTSGVVGPTTAGIRFAQGAGTLLEQAREATMAARQAQSGHVLRLGVPGQVGHFPRREGLLGIARELRVNCADVRLDLVGVPFADLTSSVVEGHIDVVWSVTTSLHPQLSSVPLVPFSRVGIVGRMHEFADAGRMNVEVFVEQPMLLDPVAEPDWMAPWYLADVRPAREARLVGVSAQDVTAVLRQVLRGHEVTVLPEPVAVDLPPQIGVIQLDGAPPADFVATFRRQDRREPLLALVAAMRKVGRRLYGAHLGGCAPSTSSGSGPATRTT